MKNLSILIPLLLITTLSISQSIDKKVVLINGVATEVVITTDGEVAELIEKKADFMTEFVDSKNENSTSVVINAFTIPTEILSFDDKIDKKNLDQNFLPKINDPSGKIVIEQKEEE